MAHRCARRQCSSVSGCRAGPLICGSESRMVPQGSGSYPPDSSLMPVTSLKVSCCSPRLRAQSSSCELWVFKSGQLELRRNILTPNTCKGLNYWDRRQTGAIQMCTMCHIVRQRISDDADMPGWFRTSCDHRTAVMNQLLSLSASPRPTPFPLILLHSSLWRQTHPFLCARTIIV